MSKTPNQPEYLLRQLKDLSLAAEIKSRIRADISAYADFHTFAGSPASSSRWSTLSSFFATPRVALPAALLLVAFLTGGTAFAAEGTLPGDALYSVKVNVTEPVKVALASSPKARAQVHAELAEQRLEEGAKLAIAKKLNPATQTYLAEAFSKHVDASLAAAQTLQADGKTSDALDAHSDLEARITAHADILGIVDTHLVAEGDVASTSEVSTHQLLQTVLVQAEAVGEARLALEDAAGTTASESDTLALVSKTSASVPVDTGPAGLPSVSAHVSEANHALVEAKQSLESNAPKKAARAFQKAHQAERASEVASILFQHRDFLSSIDTASTTPAVATTTSATTTENTTATTTHAN